MAELWLNGCRVFMKSVDRCRTTCWFSPLIPSPSSNLTMAEPSTAATGIFLALHISGGIVGLPIAVATIVASKQVSRHPTLINFCITWFISSLIYTLLYDGKCLWCYPRLIKVTILRLYAGHIRDDDPPSNLCLAQAAMSAGAFPMCVYHTALQVEA